MKYSLDAELVNFKGGKRPEQISLFNLLYYRLTSNRLLSGNTKKQNLNLSNQVMAQKEDFVDFIKNYPSGTPVVMVNILKFKEKTGIGDQTGKQSYATYSKATAPLLEKVKGQVIYAGKATKTLIGDTTDTPNQILIVKYPSKEAFIEMTTSEEYVAISHLRENALEYGGLIATESLF